MMLEAPPILLPAVGAGFLFCLLLGSVFSIPAVWHRLFRTVKDDHSSSFRATPEAGSTTTSTTTSSSTAAPSSNSYTKATDTGESELPTDWSVFKEPLNAWSSLSYTVFGIAIFLVGSWDYLAKLGDEEDLPNALAKYNEFSMMLGSFCFYLGIASFLSHASHLDTWRKADAGMASGIGLPLLLFGLWDRLRPPLLHPYAFVVISNVLLLSLTQGYSSFSSFQDGSSSYSFSSSGSSGSNSYYYCNSNNNNFYSYCYALLQPLLIIAAWLLELLPRFGGAVDEEEYTYFLQCLLSLLGGALLWAVDNKRRNGVFVVLLLTAYFLLVMFFSAWLGFMDYTIVVAFSAGFYVATYPELGHVFWHVFTAYALFIWWLMLRLRPGDPITAHGSDTSVLCLLLFLATKAACRRLLHSALAAVAVPVAYRDRFRLLLEHTVFTLWGYYCLLIEPSSSLHSWLRYPVLCWFLPVLPHDSFQLYFTAKCASHIEDAFYLWSNGSTFSAEVAAVRRKRGKILRRTTVPSLSTRAERANSELMRALHHNISFLLCVVAFFTGYAKIASLVMFMHDVSDIPLDFFIAFSLKGWRRLQLLSLFIAAPVWIYWRLLQFPLVVLYSIATQSKSMIHRVACEPGHCSWRQVPERAPFLLLLLVLLALNFIWLLRMLTKGYRILFPKSFHAATAAAAASDAAKGTGEGGTTSSESAAGSSSHIY